jgi:hypothetical protein
VIVLIEKCQGISRHATDEDLLSLFSEPFEPLESDFSFRNRGQVWFKFASAEVAQEVLLKMHQRNVEGVSLIVRFELGVDSTGRRLVDKNSHHTIIRAIQPRKGDKISKLRGNGDGVSYSHRSIFCGEIEYPFPTGLYLTRVIQLMNLYPRDDPLLRILSDTAFFGNKYSKEISECLAMADATQRAVRMVTGDCCSVYDLDKTQSLSMPSEVMVYVLGDGVRPLCAAAICLHIPSRYNWRYVSIDPLLQTEDLEIGAYSSCLEVVKGYSQDYQIPPRSSLPPSLSIVIACHSHAPLAEFWERVPSPKIAITMACCADYSDLPAIEPIFQFSDYEVYSPKREVKIYSSDSIKTTHR